MASPFSFLIVGSGVFGASTAYHLSKSHPKASIAILDRSSSFPCSLAASHDFNKIIRADYGNAFYCELALESREAWKNDPLYKPFYHQSGMVVLGDTSLGRKIIKNYEDLKAHSECVLIGPDEMKARYEGLFADAEYEGVDKIFINPLSGWAEAASAVRAVIGAAVAHGVKYIEADVAKLLFDNNGHCTGVETKDGDTISAEKVILSTGAGTAKLLADSAPDRAELQSGDRITAAAVVTGVVKLNEKQIKRFEKAPVFIHAISGVLGMSNLIAAMNICILKHSTGGVLPPTPDGILKFCVDVSFKNTTLHPASGQMISAPPDEPDQAQHTIPSSLKAECSRVVKGICGKELEKFEFDSFRICWYAPPNTLLIAQF
jgi:sarcosine oxidase/L-pipecolate oxidase